MYEYPVPCACVRAHHSYNYKKYCGSIFLFVEGVCNPEGPQLVFGICVKLVLYIYSYNLGPKALLRYY